MLKVERLKANDYNELLDFYNLVFTKQNARLMDFTKELPAMWIRDDEYMRRHFVIRENGKIVSSVGVYPMKTYIAGEEFIFSTLGNVATHPDCEGRGYMKTLMSSAIGELAEIKADAARLGGLRQRYNRYGFESCGSEIHFSFTERNKKILCAEVNDRLKFREVFQADEKALKFISSLGKEGIWVDYGSDFGYRATFLALTAWNNRIFVAEDAFGNPVSYLCAFPDAGNLSRIFAKDEETLMQTVCSWQRFTGKTVEFTLAPWQVKEINTFYPVCEGCYVNSPSMFKIINWQKIVLALMKLKSSYAELPDGEFILGIECYGNLRLKMHGGAAFCEKTEKEAEFKADALTASRLLFGPLSADCFAFSNTAKSWFPLPLSWNTQDRM